MSSLPPVPYQSPLLDANSLLTPAWRDWLQKAYQRMGGSVASTNSELFTVKAARLDSSVAGSGLSGGNATALAVNVDNSTIDVNLNKVEVKPLGITAAQIASNAVSFIKLLSTDWTSSLGASGYQKLPSGLYIQWGVTGSIASAAAATVTFPIAFPTACFQVIPAIQNDSAAVTTATGQWGSGGYSTTGCSIYNRTSVSCNFNYIAVGN